MLKKMSVCKKIKISSVLVLTLEASPPMRVVSRDETEGGGGGDEIVPTGALYREEIMFSRGDATAGGNGKLRKCMWRV